MSTLTLRLDAYDKDAKTTVHAAQTLADERRHAEVDPLHLLYVLLERDSRAQAAVQKAGVDPTDVLVEAELFLRKRASATSPGGSYLSTRMLDLLSRAEAEAMRKGRAVSIEELFGGCASEEFGAVAQILRTLGLSSVVLRAAWAATSGATASPTGATPAASASPGASPATAAAAGTGAPAPSGALAEFGIDLVAEARDGRFDPVVGRDGELRRVLQVLARRRENNPLLVGEPGIGKSSIVHALAQRLAKDDVPGMLRGKRLVALDVGALVAGAKLRGQLEERMRALLAEVRASGGEVILFAPDLGAFTGQAAAAGDLLAAALGRGEVRVIAVATPDQARKFVEEHGALSRRFVPIPIDPPTIDGTVAILRGISSRFEHDHSVRIADPALISAAHFARRYVQGVELPKSAVDLIDEAAARVRVERDSAPTELDALERRIESLEIEVRSLDDETDSDSKATKTKLEADVATHREKARALRERWEAQRRIAADVRTLERELTEAKKELESEKAKTDAAYRDELEKTTIPSLETRLDAARKELEGHGAPLVRDVVMPEDVADVVASWTGVPVAKMMEEETAKLLRMEESLRKRVVGQDPAVHAISRAVRRGRVGLRDPKRPIGSFLFLGPTGVGKTELAKALAEFLFDDEAALTRLDMSEFMEKHMVARLLGAPPGYVDSDAGGFLTEAVRRRPYSVVLFDEMEKAHPDVFNILLQVLDDGRLTDSKGRPAWFQDTVVILTSNVGSQLVLDHEGTNEELRAKVKAELERRFRPEFLNRIDDIVVFDPLDKEKLSGIADIQLAQLGKLLANRRIGLSVSPAARARLVDLGFEPAFGARPLKRVIQRELQDPLAEEMLRGGYQPGETVEVDVEGERFVFKKRSPSP
ncbi:MAG: AAA family ATPase [Polyangiales bacterium]